MVKGKRKEGGKKEKKGRKGGKKREKGEELCQNRILKGVKKIYFPPICKTYLLGRKISFQKGGEVGKNMIFGENIYPLL